MSLQGGRCVVSFTQQGQEVLKGVADYLRYAGEDRIKKWRRHVRMVGECGFTACSRGGGVDVGGSPALNCFQIVMTSLMSLKVR
jgi:hypothetical protein